jgi:hypothetical protein
MFLFIAGEFEMNKNVIENNWIIFGNGWHDIESYDGNVSIWSTDKYELLLKHRFDKIEIMSWCPSYNVHCIKIQKNEEERFQLVSDFNRIPIILNGESIITFSGSVFSPKNFNKNSNDDRILGIRVMGILIYDGEQIFPMSADGKIHV